MQNKKTKFIAIAMLSLLGLTACSKEVVAKPTGYDDGKIVNVDGYTDEIYNNLLNIVYDEIREGSLGSNVLNKVLYQYALSIFGYYDAKVEGYTEGVTLEQAANDASADNAKINEFIKAHKAFWTYNNKGEHVDDNGAVVADDKNFTPSNSERTRVKEKFANVEKRIAEKMYDNISSGSSYSDRSLFYESRFLMSLRGSMKKVANPRGTTPLVGLHEAVLLDPDVEAEYVFDNFLTRDFYQSEEFTYIEDEIVPGIFREMLVEQYILDKQYTTLGRSYARKVNVVSIATNDKYPLASRYLVNEFVDKYISGERAAPKDNLGNPVTSVAESQNKVNLDTLKVLSNAWKGVALTAEEEELLIGSEAFEKNAINNYYYGTEYGDMMEDYEKIDNDLFKTDSSIESDFTNSGAYTKETGRTIKEREIQLKDHTENGWYIKNGGLSDLPETIRKRLFNVNVANDIVENDATKAAEIDRWQYKDGNWVYEKDALESSYLAKINGSYFLKAENAETSLRDMVHYDSSSSTYYIVQVEEASSTSKLSKTNENRYSETRGDDVMEEFVNEICQIVASNDTYQTLSTKHWLEEAVLKYHDDVVYDYFKTNYPELFE